MAEREDPEKVLRDFAETYPDELPRRLLRALEDGADIIERVRIVFPQYVHRIEEELHD